MTTPSSFIASRALVAFLALAVLFAAAPPAAATGNKTRDAACPFTGEGVVDFGTQRLVASKGITEFSRDASFPVGEYTVWYFSYDGYVGRENADVSRQDEEQWNVLFLDADGNEIVTLGPTEDVPDGVELGEVTGSFGDNIAFSRAVARVVVRHVRYPQSDEPHSVVPRCVQVVKKETPEKPVRPACPFTPGENRTIVEFEKKLRSDKGWQEAQSPRVPLSLTPGIYSVSLAAWDGYPGRELTSQPDERYKVILTNDAGFMGGTASTLDLEDGVVEAQQVNLVHDGDFLLTEEVTQAYAQHAVYPDTDSPNSVYPLCAAFERVGDPPSGQEPVCELWADPNAVEAGATSTLYWRAENVTGGSVDQGIGAVGAEGSVEIAPNQTTTYTGTFTGSGGATVTCSTTVGVYVVDEFPQCTLTVNPAKVTSSSQEVTLSWTSVNTVGGTITPDVGSVAATGSTTVVPGGSKTYTGVFKDSRGNEATCSASVSRGGGGGGGGSCLNCGGGGGGGKKDEPKKEKKEPKVVVAKKVVKAKPGSFVYLNQVPYTGFEASPFATALFWAFLLAVSAALSYFLVMRDGARKLWRWFAGTSLERTSFFSSAGGGEEEYRPAPDEQESDRTAPELSVSSLTAAAPLRASAREAQWEQLAQRESVLISPDAQRALLRAEEKEGSFLGEEIIELAKETYAREDGWILLSPERIQSLLARRRGRRQSREEARATQRGDAGEETKLAEKEDSPLAAALSAVVGSAAQDRTPPPANGGAGQVHTETSSPPERESLRSRMKKFLSALSRGDQRGAYRILQKTQAAQVEPDALIRLLLRELDEAYKHRLEGGRKPDREVVALTSAWDDRDFERLLSVFADSVDFSYGSPLVGAKIALSKLNGFFTRRGNGGRNAPRET